MAIFILRPKNADIVEVLAPDCFLGLNFTKKKKEKIENLILNKQRKWKLLSI